MSFKEVTDLDADTTIALGGLNKKTGKPNPKEVEGYYLGNRQVESKKSKTGFCKIYTFQTAKGNIGVWGKTDLDRKMENVNIGTMVRVTHTGMRPTPNGEMYKYKVEVDEHNSIEVAGSSNDVVNYGNTEEDYSTDADDTTEEYSTSDADAEEAEQQAALEAAERAAKAAKVQALLKKKGAAVTKTN